MKSLLIFSCSFLISLSGFSQVQVLSGTTLTIAAGTTLTLPTGLNINAGAALSDAGILDLKQDLVNNGNLGVTGTVSFTGVAAQQITGSGSTSIPVLQINNAAGLTLQSPVTITNQLQLTTGNLTTSVTNPLHLSATAVNPAEAGASRIIGTAIMDARSVGVSAFSKMLDIQLTAGADIGNLTITRLTGPTATVSVGSNTSINASWIINSTITPTVANRNATFSWLSDNDNGKNTASMDLYAAAAPYTHNTKLNGTGQNVSASNPRAFTQNGIADFNRRFAISDIVSPLPLQLLSFEAVKAKSEVVVTWTTANEQDIDHMIVERSVDGIAFAAIASAMPKEQPYNEYSYGDADILLQKATRAYYRLHIQDKSGKGSYSAVRTVLTDQQEGVIQAYPNPFTGRLSVSIPGNEPASVTVTDVTGRVVYKNMPAMGTVTIDGLESLQPGLYFLMLTSQTSRKSVKLTKK